MRTLRQCLLDCDLALLRVIAERWGVELASHRQHDVAAELAAALAVPEAQAELGSALTPAEREALGALLAADGSMPVGAFVRRFGEIRLMGPGRLERERPWADPHSAAESLWYHGLIYRAFDEGPGEIHEVIYIPPELRTGLQAWIVPQPLKEDRALPLAPVPEQIEAWEPGLNDDVCTVLSRAHQNALAPAPCDEAWQRRHPALLAQLVIPPRTPDRQKGWQDYVEFLIHIAGRAGLLKLDDQCWRPAPDQAMAWLRASSFEQSRALFEAWRGDPTWNELWRTPGLRCEDTGSWRNDPLVARQTALDYLALMQPGQWYDLDGFITAIKSHRPDFQRPGGDYDGWYIRDAQTGDYLRGFESWDKVDGALLRYLLAGPLTWLDVVHVLLPAGGKSRLVLTETGAALLGKSEPPAERGDTRFEASGEGLVQVGNARRFERFQLARVADWVQIQERVWMFQITPASLERAKRQRISAERVVGFLEASAGQPVPATLTQALRRWSEHGTEAWAGPVVMLRVARPELLEKLMGAPATRRLIREPISSTAAAVWPKHWPALQRALLEMGILVEKPPGEISADQTLADRIEHDG